MQEELDKAKQGRMGGRKLNILTVTQTICIISGK